jgi:CheY-like chemotaxis protein
VKPPTLTRRRVLVIDDNEAIHADFRKILAPQVQAGGFAAAKAAFLGAPGPSAGPATQVRFELDTAGQGQEGVQKAQAACAAGEPYLMAFVDMRMPPGWDGATTIKHLWRVDPHIQVVICTAFSDCSLETLADELGHSDQLLILKKPFDNAEVYQLATALSEKRIAHQVAAL